MILANSTWGGWLAACGVPGIYRSQASLAPGIKVRMGTQPAPHAGMGVAQYAWATSPLRRYVDLVNQWQIVACARHGRTAALVAPFKPKDVQLLATIADFDASYAAYNAFQAQIERYWSLQYLAQNDLHELDADRDEGRRGARRRLAAGLSRRRRRAARARQRGAGARRRGRPADARRRRVGDRASRRRQRPAIAAATPGDDDEGEAAGRPARDRDRRLAQEAGLEADPLAAAPA